MAKWLISLGIALIVTGGLLYLFPNLFTWFGRLPGDLRIETGRTKIFIPLTSMLLISIVLSVALSLLKR